MSMMTIHGAKGLEWPMVMIPDLARKFPWKPGSVFFDPDLRTAVDLGGEAGKGILYRVIAERKSRVEEAEARRVFYVAPTRARDQLILTSTHEMNGNLSGLTLLAPGLDAAGIKCKAIPFRPEDAVPPELTVPLPSEPPGRLLRPVD